MNGLGLRLSPLGQVLFANGVQALLNLLHVRWNDLEFGVAEVHRLVDAFAFIGDAESRVFDYRLMVLGLAELLVDVN